MFLALYYVVLIERHRSSITFAEVLLYVWIAAFAYEEFGVFQDAGTLFYAADFWSLWDIGIVGIGVAFLVASTCRNPQESEPIALKCLALAGPKTLSRLERDILHIRVGDSKKDKLIEISDRGHWLLAG